MEYASASNTDICGFKSRSGYFAVMPQMEMGRSRKPVIRVIGLGVRSRLPARSVLRLCRVVHWTTAPLSQRLADVAELAKAHPR